MTNNNIECPLQVPHYRAAAPNQNPKILVIEPLKFEECSHRLPKIQTFPQLTKSHSHSTKSAKKKRAGENEVDVLLDPLIDSVSSDSDRSVQHLLRCVT